MTNFGILSMDLCDNLSVLRALLFVNDILNIILILVPALLLLLITIDCAKAVLASDDSAFKKIIPTAIKRMIVGVAIFFVPTVVSLMINILNTSGIDSFGSCLGVSEESFNSKKEIAKASCKGENVIWNEKNLTCDVIKEQDVTVDKDTSKDVDKDTDEDDDKGTNNNSTQRVKQLIYYNQGEAAWKSVPFCSGGKKLQGSGCGAMVLSMMASTYSSKSYNPKVVANWLCNNGHKGGAMSSNWFTNSKFLNKFNLSSSVLFQNGNNKGNSGKKYNSAQGEKLLNAVKEGKGILLYIPGHYVAVGPNPNCSSNQVYLYDVGRRAYNGCYTPSELFSKTYNYNSKCTKQGNCGWKGAWVFTEGSK